MRKRKKRLVDPLQYAMSIQAQELESYVPAFGWEAEKPTQQQQQQLEQQGILPDAVATAGQARQLLDRLQQRRTDGLTTPKQIRFLEQKGFVHVGTWSFEAARQMIDRIAASGWRLPPGVKPSTYKPEG